MGMTAGTAADRATHVRRGLVLWTVGLVGIGLLYRSSLVTWVRLLWNEPEASIGMLVPFVTVYLVWMRRDLLRATPARPAVSGAVTFLLAVVCATLAQILWFGTGIRFAFYCAVVALTWAAWGSQWLRTLAVPLAFLFFAQPLPVTVSAAITHPLRLAVTRSAATILSLGGLPAVAEGAFLHMPTITLETTAACSGLRGFVASLALALLIADVIRGPRWATGLLFPGALLLAYVLNTIRVVVEGVWTVASGAPSSEAVHTTLGLVTFAGVAILLTLWQLQTSKHFA